MPGSHIITKSVWRLRWSVALVALFAAVVVVGTYVNDTDTVVATATIIAAKHILSPPKTMETLPAFSFAESDVEQAESRALSLEELARDSDDDTRDEAQALLAVLADEEAL